MVDLKAVREVLGKCNIINLEDKAIAISLALGTTDVRPLPEGNIFKFMPIATVFANAPEWLREMADEIEQLRAENAELKGQRDCAHRRLRSVKKTRFVHNLLFDLGYESKLDLGGNDGNK